MTPVERLQQMIRKLSAQERAELRAWVLEHDLERKKTSE
jgi:hypothetical protein